MEGVRIIHTGDIHLGGKSDKVTESIVKETFMYIIKLCSYYKTDFLLIAGDFFDTPLPDKKLVRYVADAFNSIPDVQVVISPGNHDCCCKGSPYLADIWSDNVHIFTDKLECMEYQIRNQTVRIYGAAFKDIYQRETLLTRRKIMRDISINIGLMHGDVVSSGGTSVYNPITIDDIDINRFDYMALGHIHKNTAILKGTYGDYAYCGCPEGRGFDEAGIKGVYVGIVYSGGTELEFIRSSRRRYFTLDYDLQNLLDLKKSDNNFIESFTMDELASELMTRIKDGCIDAPEDIFVNIRISDSKGQVYKNHINEDVLRQLLRKYGAVNIDNRLPDIEVRKDDFSCGKVELEEKFLERMERYREGTDERIFEKALQYGIEEIQRSI